ncbi:MAG TPA: SRPBCC family protein [Gaiellaceae bacterium]|nr:SRPBCC family protein [Gaiellaceae bacterium]
MAQYRFLDEWHLPAEVDRVYDLLGRPLEYPRWWGDVFLAAEGDSGEPTPGKRIAVVARGFLPYRLRFSLTTLEAERPYRIHSRLDGDFEGTGTWLLAEDEDGTRAQLDWRPDVRKPGVRELSPLLRPLFRANHSWTMRRGLDAAARTLADEPPA